MNKIQSVLTRCLAHVRALDLHRVGRDRTSANLKDDYDMSLWIGCNFRRAEFIRKAAAAKSSSSAARTDGWVDYNNDRSVRCRSVYP
jgi:hypothetical protein